MQPTSKPSTESSSATPDQGNTRRRRILRRWGYPGLLVLAGILLLLGGAPWLVSCRWCHDWLLRQASHNIHGHFAVDQLRLGWLSPPRLKGFEIHPHEGPALLVLPEVNTPEAFYRFWIGGTDLGTWVLDQPQIRLDLDSEGTNFEKTFIQPSPLVERVAKSLVHDHRFAAQIVAGRFVFSRDEQPSWSIDNLQATVGFLPPTPGDPSPHVSLQPGTLLDQFELSPPICNDLLKFVAPVLSGATWVEGRVSLDLAEVDIPLREPAAGQLAGEMRIHAVRAGPGPLVTQLANLLGLPSETQLIDESVVQFRMRDGQVTHEGLEFQVGPVHVLTQGQIALADESLEMTAELQFPVADEEAGPLRRALSGRTISVPITGTLRQPKLGNGEGLPGNLTDLLEKARQLLERREWDRGEGILGGERPLRESGGRPLGPVRDAVDAAREASDAAPRETPLLDLFRRLRSPDGVPPPSATDAPPDGPDPPPSPVEASGDEDPADEDPAEPSKRRRLLPRLFPRQAQPASRLDSPESG